MPSQRINTSRGNYFYLVVIVTLLSLLAITLQVRRPGSLNFFAKPVLILYGYAHEVLSTTGLQIGRLGEIYIFLQGVEEENRLLKHENGKLRYKNSQYIEYKNENERLRKLLQFKGASPMRLIPTQVIARTPSHWFKSILISQIAGEKISKYMAVITHEGVVGRIEEVTPVSARVLLITDQNSSIAVIVQRSRAEGIVSGWQENICKLNYLIRSADIKPGDVVISSGLGGVFPKGLVVGRITKVEKQGHDLFQYAEVEPSANLSNLEEVMVVYQTTPESPGVPQ